MTSFGQALIAARQSAGIQQKAVAAAVIKEDGGSISASYLHDLEHDRRQPSDHIIEQLAVALRLPDANFLYYLAGRFPPHLRSLPKASLDNITAAYQAFTDALDRVI